MIPQPQFTKISLKITYLKLNWNLPGANELNPHCSPADAIHTHKKKLQHIHDQVMEYVLPCLDRVITEALQIRPTGANNPKVTWQDLLLSNHIHWSLAMNASANWVSIFIQVGTTLPSATKYMKFESKHKLFTSRNIYQFENAICKMRAILFRPPYADPSRAILV